MLATQYVHVHHTFLRHKKPKSYLNPNERSNLRSESGSILVLTSLAVLMLLGIVALAVERGLWLHAHAREFGGDPARIHVSGSSAGGHLAAAMLVWERFGRGLRRTELEVAVREQVDAIAAWNGVPILDYHPRIVAQLPKLTLTGRQKITELELDPSTTFTPS